jgi:aldose sugar dehydrogenase
MDKRMISKFNQVAFVVILISSLPLMSCAEATETGSLETDPPEFDGNSEHYFPLPDSEGEIIESEELNFYVQTVVTGLGVPWGMAFLPDGHVLISERSGTLRLVRDGELSDQPVGGVPEVRAQGQGGLLDIALHPDYEENGWIYISYSKPGDGGAMTAIMRAKFNADSHSLTDQEEIYVGTPFTGAGQHFGSRIAFDHDGYLYFSIGDRGNMSTAQDINNSMGNLFRLHDDGRIPADNPFVGREGLDEIFAYGLRNIQGMATHPETGVIWTNLHGPRGGDELNVHDKPGANYGWPEITYGVNYNGTPITEHTEMEGMEQPVMHWTPSIAPSGMSFVTSDYYPGWQGDVLNGALAFQLISRIVLDGDEFVHEERILEGIGRIRDVHEAPDGFIYFSNESNGTLNRIIPVE